MKVPLERLRQEHRVIAAAGGDLLRALNEVESDAMVARAAVEAIAAVYLVYYRHHLSSEEREVLPQARRLLAAKDWEAVEALPAGRDPLFGEKGDTGYRELRRHIIREGQPD
jgi:hemerythrin-like domain-containing protein